MGDLSRSTRLILLAGVLAAVVSFARTLLLADPETGLMPEQLYLKPLIQSRDHAGEPAMPLSSLWLAGEYSEAFEIATGWVEADPDSLDATYWAALAAIELDDAASARTLFRSLKRRAQAGLERESRRGLSWLRIAWAEQGLGNPEAAIEALAFAEHAADGRTTPQSGAFGLDLVVLATTLTQQAALDPEAPPGLVDRALDAFQAAVRAGLITPEWARADPGLAPLRVLAPEAFEACLDPLPFNPRSLPLPGAAPGPAVWSHLPQPVGLPPE